MTQPENVPANETEKFISMCISIFQNKSNFQFKLLFFQHCNCLTGDQMGEITALLQNILPALKSGNLEGSVAESDLGTPLGQSTPKGSNPLPSTAGDNFFT